MKNSDLTKEVLACVSLILGLATDFMFFNYTNFLFIRRFLRIFGSSEEISLLVCAILAIFLGSIALYKNTFLVTRFVAILGILAGMFYLIWMLLLLSCFFRTVCFFHM